MTASNKKSYKVVVLSALPVAAAVVATVMAATAIEALGEAGAGTSIDIAGQQARGSV